jgi:hypothetical protein
MENYKDFDEFFDELEKKPAVTIKLYGKEYDLPTEIPAVIMLETFKAYKSGKKEVSEEKQLEMAFALLGEENVTEWCSKGLSMTKLAQIMKWAAGRMRENTVGGGNKKK